tara:strand:- start:393 stop:2066 length:1674 start_codon:yes stop_codon:yes gene_type:complete
MGWWETFKKGATGVKEFATTGTSGNAAGDLLLSAGVSKGLDALGMTQPNVTPSGYQGGIPSYKTVRERVPTDPNRRAGGENQRYFTDTQFAMGEQGFKESRPQSIEEAKAKAIAERDVLAKRNTPAAQSTQAMAAGGGVASAYNRPHNGYYLGGMTDGMADEVPASIDGKQEARLSDGEFVIPADVVSHLGNGNSDAGADQLHGMMDNVRMERTGNPEQGKQIDPNKFMPTMAQGGIANAYNYGGSVRKFNEGGTTTPVTDVGSDPNVGKQTGTESSLSSWAGPYVTDMMGKGAALAEQGYQAYEGPLTAGTNELQQKSFTGIGNLDAGTMGVKDFTAADATAGMNPYLMASLNPQIDEARRQSEIDRVANAGRMTQAGAFGGSRQALMDSENQRNLQTNIADITGQGYASAYDRAQEQFNKTQASRNQYGFDVLGGQATAGAKQRDIEQQGLSADQSAFEEERDFPYKQVQYMQSLLQGLPLEAQSYTYSQPSDLQTILGGTAGVSTILDALRGSYGGAGGGTGAWEFGNATQTQVESEYTANPSITPAEIVAKYA